MSLKLPRNWDFSTFKAETARIARSRSVIPGVGGSRPGSPLSPRSMERPLKAGWLKKQQRSLVKNWQQRYFVLRGSSLTYHKDDKETTVQGVIQLRFSKVNELSPNCDDPGKHLFEIIPRTTKDREPCPYVLMANSQNDMDEWVRTLRRVIGVPTSGVFGRSLMDTVTYEQRFGPHMVPILVQKCVEFIKEHGLEEEGIFRLPGQDNAVKQFRDAFDAGERPSFPSDTDVHTVASLLKLYLRELPEPVVPWTQYQAFLDCTEHPDSSSTEGWGNLEKQIALLPRNNYNLLSYVCRFLFEVQLHCQVNKMNVENLATVMGINLLKPQIEDPISVMKATPQIQKLMTVLIRQHEALLPDLRPSPPLNRAESQKSTPRSFVGWESAEMCDASAFESPEEEEDTDSPGPGPSPGPSPGGGNCSPQHERQEPCSPSTDDWTGSPRKRTQTLPTFNCPLTGMAAKTDALNRWSHIQESVEEKSGTLSEDIFKILDLRSSGSLFRKAHTGGVSERTFIATAGSGNTCSPSADSQKPASNSPLSRVLPVQKSLGTVAGMASVEQVNNGRSVQKKESQQPIGSLQQNRDLKINTGELHDIAELMSCLKEAERSRDEAQRRNLELQSTLAAESRQVADLKICLRNAERHRDEAQRRNEELTKEIQRFLDKEP